MTTKKGTIVRSGGPGNDAVLADLVRLIEAARGTATRSVNAVMTATYWAIGRRIVEHEQGGAHRAAYGEELLKRLAGDLAARLGRGFSERNLEQMRRFYLTWPISSLRQTRYARSVRRDSDMKKSDFVPRIQHYFGYQLFQDENISSVMHTFLEDATSSEIKERFVDCVFDNIHWRGEFQGGRSPLDKESQEDQETSILLRHLSGLFLFRTGFSFANTGVKDTDIWMADLNPRTDGLIHPVYYQFGPDLTRWYIFTSARDLIESEELFYAIQEIYFAWQEGKNDNARAEHAHLKEKLVTRYPRACLLFAKWFARFDVDIPQLAWAWAASTR